MLHDIATAAVDCDVKRLGELAAASPMFVASFGMDFTEAGEYADYWLRAERDGTPITAVLVRLAGAPAANQIAQMPGPGDGESRQVDMMLTPAAFNDFDSPENRAQIDELFRDILGERYVEDSFVDGSYLGWRLGVTADGDWVTFVAGD